MGEKNASPSTVKSVRKLKTKKNDKKHPCYPNVPISSKISNIYHKVIVWLGLNLLNSWNCQDSSSEYMVSRMRLHHFALNHYVQHFRGTKNPLLAAFRGWGHWFCYSSHGFHPRLKAKNPSSTAGSNALAQSDANKLAAEPIIVNVPPKVEAKANGILGNSILR